MEQPDRQSDGQQYQCRMPSANAAVSNKSFAQMAKTPGTMTRS
jgi:hypothetical protein